MNQFERHWYWYQTLAVAGLISVRHCKDRLTKRCMWQGTLALLLGTSHPEKTPLSVCFLPHLLSRNA